MSSEDHPLENLALDAALEAALAAPLDAIDRATLALHLSDHDARAGTLTAAEAARNGFLAALELLEATDAAVKQSAAWRDWHDEAEWGRGAAEQRLHALRGSGDAR